MPIPSARALALVALLSSVLFFGGPALPQSRAKDSGRLAELTFTGLNHFSADQLSNAIGLHVGDTTSPDRLDAAARLLAKSGAFDDVNFRYNSENGALKAEFRVVESEKLLPCFFDNFVWFSDDELDRALRQRVPLYAGVVPESGETTEQVRAALLSLLRTNGIEGDVQTLPHSGGIGQRVSRLDFRVTGVAIPMRTVSFPGASAISEQDLRAASKQLIGREYSVADVNAFLDAGLQPLYRRRGYLRAQFAVPHAEVIGGAANWAKPEIAVSFPVSEGTEFYWARADWTGNRTFSSDDLDHLLGMKPREVANQEKLTAGLQAVSKAYQKRGFADASVRDQLLLEDFAQTVTCEVTIDEGAQYRMGKITFAGLTENASKEMTAGWKLKSGEVYDGTYMNDFLLKVVTPALLKNGVRNMRPTAKLERDQQNAIVNIVVLFQ